MEVKVRKPAERSDEMMGEGATTAMLPITSESAIDKVTEAITLGIRAGIFVPGQHLLEPELTRRLGISRGSLREALKHLAAAGIVTLSRFRGAYISTLDRKAVRDLLDVLEPLARLAARLAADRCDTPQARRSMEDAASLIDQASKGRDRSLYLERRRHFYDTLLAISGNEELARVMPLSRTDLFRAQVESAQSKAQSRRRAAGYAEIAKAVIGQDPAAADRAVHRHFAGTRQTMDNLPPQAFGASL